MSSATQQEVNPFASPGVPVAQMVPESGPRKPNRASRETLTYVSRHASVANVVYPINLACSFLSLIPLTSWEFSQVIGAAWVVSRFVLWYSAIAMTFGSRNYILGALVALILPIPCFGTFTFLAAIHSAKEFMIGNGYRPGFLGFRPDIEDRELMKADLDYVPSRSYRNDGSKRSKVFMLGECIFFLVVLVGICFFTIL